MDKEDNPLLTVLSEMHSIDDSKDYYAFTYLVEDGKMVFEIQTHWRGWADKNFTQEIREASLVKPHVMARGWDMIKESYWVVNEARHYIVYLYLGGNALVASDVAKECDPDLLKPSVVVRSGRFGFVDIASLSKQAFNHAPTPKQRMRILKRDKYKCAICGRKPADYVDLELHVHHIRPWAQGGLTEDKNLITLCHTCHKGLAPHEEHSLFEWISPYDFSVEAQSKKHNDSVLKYREIIWKMFGHKDDNNE